MDFTEASLLSALRRKYTYPGNGGSGRWAFLTHVRVGASFSMQEIDALAIALWPSEGFLIHAFEVKTSRSDWLREIRPDTSKSATTRARCDSFTIVAPAGVVRRTYPAPVRPEELPEGWGLIEARDDGLGGVRLRTAVKAATKPQDESTYLRTIQRDFLVPILRAAGCVPGMLTGAKREAVV